MSPVILYFFRGFDLRIDDNPLFAYALNKSRETSIPILAIWRIHPDELAPDALLREKASISLPRLGPHRYRFLCEASESLRDQLNAYQIPLIQEVASCIELVNKIQTNTSEGESLVGSLQKSPPLSISEVILAEHGCYNERQEERKILAWGQSNNIPVTRGWIHTLYHPKELPFKCSQIPLGFTSFRKQIEENDLTLMPPETMPHCESFFSAQTQLFESMEHSSFKAYKEIVPHSDSLATLPETARFHGSHAAGHQRLHYYVHASKKIRSYKETRNGLLDDDTASRFSPWLAAGVLSPRQIMHEIKQHEAEYGSNKSTYWLYFELLWREFFQFLALFQGRTMFTWRGLQGQLGGVHQPSVDRLPPSPARGERSVPPKGEGVRYLSAWHKGETGVPLNDASMQELIQTGYTTNRARQNVASLLAKGLALDWRLGATIYEHYLLDYDPASNWGNWQYVAGVGTDPKDRVFNLFKQSRDYDKDGGYVNHWLPYLRGIESSKVHAPHTLTDLEKGLFETSDAIPELLPTLDNNPASYRVYSLV